MILPTNSGSSVHFLCSNGTYDQHVAARPNSLVAAVGDAWEMNYNAPQAVRLHTDDDSHPAFNGSYLARQVLQRPA